MYFDGDLERFNVYGHWYLPTCDQDSHVVLEISQVSCLSRKRVAYLQSVYPRNSRSISIGDSLSETVSLCLNAQLQEAGGGCCSHV